MDCDGKKGEVDFGNCIINNDRSQMLSTWSSASAFWAITQSLAGRVLHEVFHFTNYWVPKNAVEEVRKHCPTRTIMTISLCQFTRTYA